MKSRSTIFLQFATVLIAIAALIVMIRLPLTEGRAQHADLFHIYSDPFILYVYVGSLAFFIALYQSFRLLGYIGKNQEFSFGAVTCLKRIKQCAVVLTVFILGAGIFILLFHAKEDDPAGFLALCMAATIVSITMAIAAFVFEKILQHGVDLQSGSEKLQEQFKK